MKELSQLKDFDVFFYYGEKGSDVNLEIESDLIGGIIQSKRSLYYNRNEGCGVTEKENFPNVFSLQISVKYDITNFVALRNEVVSDGTEGTVDRRVITSQNIIRVENDSKKNMNIDVPYVRMKDTKNVQNITIPITKG